MPVRWYGCSACGWDSDMAMSRYPAPARSAARNSGITNRGSVAFISTSQLYSVSSAAVAASSRASSWTAR